MTPVTVYNFPSLSPTPIATITPTTTPTPTETPTIIITPISTPTPTPTNAPTPTVTPTLTPTNTPTPSPTSTPTPTNTPTPTMTPVPTVTMTPAPTITPTPTVSLTPTPTASPSPTPSLTPTPTPTPNPIGNDISYPQCDKTYPTGHAFGIVGVNGGIASTSNPCLSSELGWAKSATGTSTQPKIQLYVNTGNPGGLNTVTWPHNNTDPAGNVANNPYGTCDGNDTIACAWQYGWNRAVDDVISRFQPAARDAGISDNPSTYPWWLDVETVNSWKDGSDAALQSNTADLEAMVAYFKSIEVKVGMYSTSYQFGIVVGSLPTTSSLVGLDSWLPGASTLDEAKSNCSHAGLTSGSEVIFTQYTTNGFDYDYACK